MQRVFWRILLVGLSLNAAATAQSQSGVSLGDLARANHVRQQEEEATGKTPKIITNQDLPSAPSAIPESSEPMTTVSGVKRPAGSYSERGADQRLLAWQRADGQWKARIQDQEARISDLQMRIDRANQAMRAAVGTVSCISARVASGDRLPMDNATPASHQGGSVSSLLPRHQTTAS